MGSPCSCLSQSPPLIKTPVTRDQDLPQRPHFSSVSHLSKGLTSEYSHILRCWGLGFGAGANSVPNSRVRKHPFFFFFFKIFLCGSFFKSLSSWLQYCFYFMFLVFWPQGMWDLSPSTGIEPHPLHWKVKSSPPGKFQKSPLSFKPGPLGWSFGIFRY